MISAYRRFFFYIAVVFAIMPASAVEIQFLGEKNPENLSYERFCEIMDKQGGVKANEKEPFCSEQNINMYYGLPFVKSMAQLFSLHGAILQQDTTNEGTSGDGLTHDGPRFFGSVFFNALEAKVICKNLRRVAPCDDIHKHIEEEIQRSFFFVRCVKNDQYYYFTNAKDDKSGEFDSARSILLGEFVVLDSSLHAESQKIFREYTRKYGKPNHDSRRNDVANSNAWKDKSGRFLYLVHFKIGEDLMHNFSGLQEFSVDKIYAGSIYSEEIARVKQRVMDKVRSIKSDKDAEHKKLLNDAIK